LFTTAATALASAFGAAAIAQGSNRDGKFSYRGFTVDMSGAGDPPNPAAVEASLKHQIDIVADCGVSPTVRFYNNATAGGLYPQGSCVLKNVQEFFAVTGSPYLWGNVDRPRIRGKIRARSSRCTTNGSASCLGCTRIAEPTLVITRECG
jgi:hypothetical protein